MKQRELIKKLEQAGFVFERHGDVMTFMQEAQKKKKFQGIRKLMKGWQRQL